MRIKLQQQQQKLSDLSVDATSESTVPIAILNRSIFSNHDCFQYEQMKYYMVILIKKTSQCLDLILLELVRPRIAPMEKETDQLLNNRG